MHDFELDVANLYNKLGLPMSKEPIGLNSEEKRQRIVMMQEELNEYHEATYPVDEYDALIDLLVFTVGTLVQSKYPLQEGWDAVMTANLQKQAGKTKRGHDNDLAKPEGWVGPELKLEAILERIATMNKNCNDCHPRFGCDACPLDVVYAPCDDCVCDDPTECPKLDLSHSPSRVDVTQMPTGGVVKDDSGKTRYELLPWDSLKQVADVFGYGAEKYFDNSWRTQDAATYNRTFGSIMRHLTEWQMGQDIDPESGLNHLAHAVSQLLILMYVEQHNPDKDDRIYSKESN